MSRARAALILLLSINLFNYVDRQVLAAVLAPITTEFHLTDTQAGSLATAFLVSYMFLSPLFGYLADRFRRWLLIAIGVILWSLASGASGLADSFAILLITRCFVGVGEAAYGPVAPTLISDLYPLSRRGAVLAWFYMAIPVGSALGYMLGGLVGGHWGWRMAFYVVVPPGIILGLIALFMPEPPRGAADNVAASEQRRKPRVADIFTLFRIPSYVLDTLGMTAMTFAIGGVAIWMPTYILRRLNSSDPNSLAHINTIFGGLTAVAGVIATLLGGWTGDKLRKKYSGAYFLVSGIGLIAAFFFFLALLVVPFPYAWALIFCAEFCLFFNTGPSNAILANVTHPSIRASAFAINIFIIHFFGDAASPYLIGLISDHYSMTAAFLFMSILLLLGGLLWLWGAKYLARDEQAALAPVVDSPQ